VAPGEAGPAVVEEDDAVPVGRERAVRQERAVVAAEALALDATAPPRVSSPGMARATGPAAVEELVARKGEFLRFVRARTGSEAEAEELLQAAFVKATEKVGAVRDDESSVAWFYRLLRNAIADLGRERLRAERAPADPSPEVTDPDLHRAVCSCVNELVPTLKPEWARLVRRVDLEGAAVSEVARDEGITANAAAVRLHRARGALRDKLLVVCGACARHGCLDCGCRPRRR
jgi:RNA polymerase sigma-70 factor (ECF subfamily)